MENTLLVSLRLVPLFLFFFLLTACVPEGHSQLPVPDSSKVDRISCSVDADCVCGGVDSATGNCFLGNRAYYRRYVDKSADCSSFCSGAEGNLVVRCVDGKCIQVMECLTDADCGTGVCMNNKCVDGVDAVSSVDETGSECNVDSECHKAGCSRELCVPVSEMQRVTICEFRPEYQCLELIDCGCVRGKCVWKTTDEYNKCVSVNNAIERGNPV